MRLDRCYIVQAYKPNMGPFEGVPQVYFLARAVNMGTLSFGREMAGVPASVSYGQTQEARYPGTLIDVFPKVQHPKS